MNSENMNGGDRDRASSVDVDLPPIGLHMIESIFKNNPAFIVIIDPKGKIIFMNDTMAETLGYSAPEFKGVDYMATFVPEREWEMLSSIFKELTGPHHNTSNENHVLTKGGKELLVKWNGSPHFDDKGEFKFFIGVGIDITQHREMERALRESEERFRGLIEKSYEGILLTDEEGKVIIWNKASEHITGLKQEDVLGKYICEVQRKILDQEGDHDVQKVGICSIVRQALKTGTSPWLNKPHDMELRKADGSIRYAQQVFFSGKTKDGYRLGAITQDVTERRKAEDKLVEQKKKAELYLDILGHDINNQNQGILTLLELFLLDYPKDGPGRSDIEQALHQAFSISGLIRNVKTISNIEDTSFELEPIDVLASVERVLKKVRITYPGKDIILNINCRERQPRVMADTLFESLLINILGNAVKFDKADPVELDLEIIPTDDGFWRFEFSDRGTGVPDNMKEEIFTRLKKGDQSSHGSGLGLAIVSSVTKQYGGRVWVEDRVKGDHTKGARFVLLLPKGGSA